MEGQGEDFGKPKLVGTSANLCAAGGRKLYLLYAVLFIFMFLARRGQTMMNSGDASTRTAKMKLTLLVENGDEDDELEEDTTPQKGGC